MHTHTHIFQVRGGLPEPACLHCSHSLLLRRRPRWFGIVSKQSTLFTKPDGLRRPCSFEQHCTTELKQGPRSSGAKGFRL